MGRGKAVSLFPSSPAHFLFFRLLQELITRSIQLPYCAYATAFSQVGLFLDKHFLRIAFEKPITSKCVINNKLLIRNQDNSFTTHARNLQRILLTVLQATISVFTRKLAVQRKICKTQKSPGRLLHRRQRIIHAKGNRNHLRNSRL